MIKEPLVNRVPASCHQGLYPSKYNLLPLSLSTSPYAISNLRSLRRALLQSLQNIPLQTLRLRRARPPPQNLPIPPDQPLLEIPLHSLEPQDPWLLALQPLEQRLRPLPIHLHLPQHGETDPIVHLAETLDLVVGARVLRAELVAGEAEDLEVGGEVRVGLLEGLVERFEAAELRGEAAFAGCVHDEEDFVLEGVQVVRAALFVGGVEVVECRCGGHGSSLLRGGGGGVRAKAWAFLWQEEWRRRLSLE